MTTYPNLGANPGSYRQKQERRAGPRRPLIVQIECRSRNFSCLGRTVDLSEGGLLMTTPESVEAGTPVEIRFVVPIPPRAVPVEVKGIVVRTDRNHSMAIQFTELDDADRETIKRYIELEGSQG